jgi:nitroimidazol reductase NimA-like FMN-containing flavoprotein (pyridoxamine 5'-phosphate oxidase superfamily)
MKEKVLKVLHDNRIMAIATMRPDGWPQNTLVGYANEDLLIYFVISRASQKFANVERDDRVSLVIGRDFHDPGGIEEVSMAAHASEVRDPRQRDHAIDLLLERHPGLRKLERPDHTHSAVMRANPTIIAVSDYSKGFGHADLLTVGVSGITEMTAARQDDWGFGSTLKPVT